MPAMSVTLPAGGAFLLIFNIIKSAIFLALSILHEITYFYTV
jgi:hypothetical protein